MKIHIQVPHGESYPSIAVVPFAKGIVTKEQLTDNWQLLEDNFPVHSYKEVVALWPDQTVKWAHIHGIFEGGRDYSFDLSQQSILGPFPPIPPDSSINWELEVEDSEGIKWKNTGADRNHLQIIPPWGYTLSLIDNRGSWSYKGSDETKYVELDNDFLRITRYEGWLKIGVKKSGFRYRTTVTCYSDHSLCKINHAVILASNRKGKGIKHISFLLHEPIGIVNHCSTGVDGTIYQFDLGQSRIPVLIHQRGITHCEVSGPGQSIQYKEKADGFLKKSNTHLFIRNFWQKFPQALLCNTNTITYRQWYGGGPFFDNLIGNVKARLLDENLHKLLHWHHGSTLENDIPRTNDLANPEWADKFYGLMAEDEGGLEEYIEYTGYADMQGITIHDDMAVCHGAVNSLVYTQLWNDNPVGHCDPSYIESTLVSDFAAKGNDFNKVENFLEASVLSYTDPARFEDYGRFVYGESHRNILPYFNRPSFHRLFLGSYYSAGETYWRMYLRGSSAEILAQARINTERYRSVVMVNYDERTGDNNGSETQWHDPGEFWYRGLWWGNVREFDLPEGEPQPPETYSGHGDWTSNYGRVPDPDSLWWSWILDGNRYHKEGYELWMRFAKPAISFAGIRPSNARLLNKTLVYTINMYDYIFNHPVENFTDTIGKNGIDIRDHILQIGKLLLTIPLRQVTAGPLWQPEWIKCFAEFLNTYYIAGDGEEVREALISRVLHFAVSNYNSNFYGKQRTMDMASLLVDINLEQKYPFYYDYYPAEVTIDSIRLSDHLFWICKTMDAVHSGIGLETEKWKNFGIGDGELGDGYLKLQWGAFLKRLRLLSIGDDLTLEYNYHGHYPCSTESRSPFHPFSLSQCYGNEYLILKDNIIPLDLSFKFAPVGMGAAGALMREIWIVSKTKHADNLVRVAAQPRKNPTANKFIPVIGTQNNPVNDPITAERYKDGRVPERRPLSYYTNTQINDYSFDAFSAPHVVDETVPVYSWNHGQWIRSATGQETYTVTDGFSVPDRVHPEIRFAENGIYRIFIGGASAYPGLTPSLLPEAMVLNPIVISGNTIIYKFLNANLYIKNIDEHETKLQFTSSVEGAISASSKKKRYGSFCRIYISKFDQAFDLPYRGTGYGQPLPEEIIEVNLMPGEVTRIKTTMIYSTNNCIRLNFNGRLLCGKSIGDILAFDPYTEEIRNMPY
jgi:hypothetical protein